MIRGCCIGRGPCEYDAAGRVTRTRSYNGATEVSRTVYGYDAADRLLSIEHQQGDGTAMQRVEYAWTVANTISKRTEKEYNAGGVLTRTNTVDYEYDNRLRLTREKRIEGGSSVYDYHYDYDGVGNRTSKIEKNDRGTAVRQTSV